VRPDQEYTLRLLARQVLDGDGRPSDGVGDAGRAELIFELRGMVQAIRRQLMIDSAVVAKKVGDALAEQAEAFNLDAVIASEVAKQAEALKSRIPWLVADAIKRTIENAVYDRTSDLVRPLISEACGRIVDQIARSK